VLELDTIAAEGRHWSIMACSAVTGDGLLEGIDFVVNDIKSRIFMME
jgi:ADP-ribosylation factor-like protein 2